MSSSRNMFEFIGNLGTAPKSQKLDNGQVMTKLFIITNKVWNDKETKERKEKSEALNVTVFGHNAKFLADYASKGDKVLVRGEVRNTEWTDKETGQKHEGLEFIVSGYGSEAMLFGKPIKSDTGNKNAESDDAPPYAGAADSHEYATASNGG